MKKILVLVLTLAMCLCLATGASAEDEKLTIGLVMMDIMGEMGADIRAGAYYQADQYAFDVEIMFIDGMSDLQTQIDGIDDCLAAEVDAIIIWPADDVGISQSVISCNDAGVPVITIDVTSAEGEVVNHVASDNIEIGRINGRLAVDYLTEKYGEPEGFVIVSGYPVLNSLRERVQGFLEIIEQYPNIEYAEHNFIDNTFEAGQALADDLMQKYPEGSFDIFYGANCVPGLGAITAASALGRTDFVVMTVDNLAQFQVEYEQNAENTILYDFVAQDPFDIGMTGMEKAVAVARGEDTGEYLSTTNLITVTPDTFGDFMAWYDEMCKLVADYR